LPWLYTWGSGRFSGVARDALYLAEQIEAKQVASRTSLHIDQRNAAALVG